MGNCNEAEHTEIFRNTFEDIVTYFVTSCVTVYETVNGTKKTLHDLLLISSFYVNSEGS